MLRTVTLELSVNADLWFSRWKDMFRFFFSELSAAQCSACFSPTAAVQPSFPHLLTKFSLVLRFPALPNRAAAISRQSCLLSSTEEGCCQVPALCSVSSIQLADLCPSHSSYCGDLWPLGHKQTVTQLAVGITVSRPHDGLATKL